jgi:hypothetical protein
MICNKEVRGFMIMIFIMMMAMMIWRMGLIIILITMIEAIMIWRMGQGETEDGIPKSYTALLVKCPYSSLPTWILPTWIPRENSRF